MTGLPDLNYQTPSAPRGNALGTAGFIVSIIGLFACGVLGPVGLTLSAFGMRKEPRGLAVAGLVIGIVSTLELIAVVVLVVFATAAASRAAAAFAPTIKTLAEMQTANTHIESYYSTHTSMLPSDADGNAVIVERDGWGHPFQYHQIRPTDFELRSAGPDGIFANGDDITQTFNTGDFPPRFLPPPAPPPAPAPEIE